METTRICGERLLKAVAEGRPVDSTVEVEAAKDATDDPAALDTGAHWHALVPDPLPVPEPANEDDDLRPPTMLDAKILQPKLEFKEEFRRMPFSGTTELLPAAVQTGKRKRTVGGLSQTRHDRTSEYPVRTEGGPDKHFLERHGLDYTSHPMDWMNALCPMTQKDNIEDPLKANVTSQPGYKFAVSNWLAYSNAKAMLVNAGDPGCIYAGKYKPMSLQDMNVQIGALILDSLAPSPQIRKKMVPQTKDETHGNNFIAKHVGSDYERKQKCFRAFFGCQNPLTVPPPRGECPNFKVDELFRWMRYILPEAWVCSPDLSADEQTAKCQCKTQHKSRCGRQKRIGDGLQC